MMILDEFSPHTLLGFAEFLRNPKRAKLQQSGFPIKQKKNHHTLISANLKPFDLCHFMAPRQAQL
jgi:hypothetical protein